MAVLLTDDFNRADNASSLGSPTSGGPYTVRSGVWGIGSNRALTTSVAGAHVTFPAAIDLDLQVTVPVLGTSAGVVFRWVDASNYWLYGLISGNWALQHNAAGSFSTFGTGPTAVAGDVLRCVAFGRNIYGYVNGRLVCYAEDQFFSVATSTAGMRASSSAATRFDDLSAADATGIPGDGSAALVYKGRDTAAADAGSEA